MKTAWKGLAVIIILASLNLGCGGMLIVREPPPADRVEMMSNAPSSEHIWIAGYWYWSGDHHWLWHEGRWERRPHERAVWERGRWEHREGRDEWEWHEGRWR